MPYAKPSSLSFSPLALFSDIFSLCVCFLAQLCEQSEKGFNFLKVYLLTLAQVLDLEKQKNNFDGFQYLKVKIALKHPRL